MASKMTFGGCFQLCLAILDFKREVSGDEVGMFIHATQDNIYLPPGNGTAEGITITMLNFEIFHSKIGV